jgi:hypothetical protein
MRESLISSVDAGYYLSSSSMEHGYEAYKAKMASIEDLEEA